MMSVLNEMRIRVTSGAGFFAALDQSGGSSPAALRTYGVADGAYSTDEQMFGLMHAMRVRIMTAPAFTSERILAAILFVDTMDRSVQGVPTPTYLWKDRGVVPFVKVDQGLEAEADGVQMLKPIQGLDETLERAARLEVFGTKARSVIHRASKDGVGAVVDQQFDLAEQVAGHGLTAIVEPEILITSPDKAEAEAMLRDALLRRLDRLPDGRQVVVKVTLPETADFYAALSAHAGVARLVALSGGYSRDEACRRLAMNHDMIASFSRALIGDLRLTMSDAVFDATLADAITQIYTASTQKS